MAASSSGPVISGNLFWEKVAYIYNSWKGREANNEINQHLWGNASGLCLLIGSGTDDESVKRSNAVSAWLTGYELTDTVIIFLPRGQVTILSSKKKIELLSPIVNDEAKPAGYQLDLLVRPLNAAEWPEHIERAMAVIKSIADNEEEASIGILLSEWGNETSKFSNEWREAFSNSGLIGVECASGWATLLATKSDSELPDLKMSASITNGIMSKLVIRNIEKTIEGEEEKKHTDFIKLVDDILANPAKISRKLDQDRVESANCTWIRSGALIAPILKSGDPATPGADKTMTFDTIACTLGVRYASHATIVSRTLFVDCSTAVQERYAFLLKLQQVAIAQMKEGNPACSVMKAVLSEIQGSEYPELEEVLLANCGAAIGISPFDPAFLLDAVNPLPFTASMVVQLRLGFTSLPKIKHPETHAPISMLIADTFSIGSDGAAPSKLTNVLSEWTNVSYTTAENEVDLEIARQYQPRSDTIEGKQLRRRVGDTNAARIGEQDEKYRQMQQELAVKKLKELRIKYVGREEGESDSDEDGDESKDDSASSSAANVEKWNPPKGYSGADEFPMEAVRTLIFVDNQKELVLFPIYGLHVPFHITTIKNVTYDESTGELRVNFVAPAGGPGGPNRTGATLPPSVRSFPNAIFVRELVFRGGDKKSTGGAFRKIQELSARIKNRETLRKTTEGLRKQESLVLTRGKVPELIDVRIRPNVGGARVARGKLLAHKNGFRYLGPKDSTVDILYANIKHSFYQQAGQTSHMVILHFHLHFPIMIGKTKAQDIQVYYEVTEASRELSSHRDYDSDGIEEEHMERRARAKHNKRFLEFCKQVRQVVPELAEFEVPYEDLAFTGVPHRSSVLLKPTVNCLVHLTDMPFFVLSLAEVEVAFFERVAFGLRNFDLVFVFSDYEKTPVRIDIIPLASLEPIKKWLTECSIVWFENPKNMNWKNVMTVVVRKDPKQFWKDGGWRAFGNCAESSSEEEQGSEGEPSEEEYEPESASSDDSESEYDDSEEDYDEDESDDSYSDSEEEDEEGLDWEELDRKAAKADRKVKPDWAESERSSNSRSGSTRAAPSRSAPAKRSR